MAFDARADSRPRLRLSAHVYPMSLVIHTIPLGFPMSPVCTGPAPGSAPGPALSPSRAWRTGARPSTAMAGRALRTAGHRPYQPVTG